MIHAIETVHGLMTTSIQRRCGGLRLAPPRICTGRDRKEPFCDGWAC